jgi:hypothetical protein
MKRITRTDVYQQIIGGNQNVTQIKEAWVNVIKKTHTHMYVYDTSVCMYADAYDTVIYFGSWFSVNGLCILVTEFGTIRFRQLPYVLLCRVTLRALLRCSYNPTDILIGHTCCNPWPSDTRFSSVCVIASRIVCYESCTVWTDMAVEIWLQYKTHTLYLLCFSHCPYRVCACMQRY